MGDADPAAAASPLVGKACCPLAEVGVNGDIDAGDGSGAPAKSAKSIKSIQ